MQSACRRLPRGRWLIPIAAASAQSHGRRCPEVEQLPETRVPLVRGNDDSLDVDAPCDDHLDVPPGPALTRRRNSASSAIQTAFDGFRRAGGIDLLRRVMSVLAVAEDQSPAGRTPRPGSCRHAGFTRRLAPHGGVYRRAGTSWELDLANPPQIHRRREPGEVACNAAAERDE
jgi:hypothetical protein